MNLHQLIVVIFLIFFPSSIDASCEKLGRCCPGKRSDACKYEFGFNRIRYTRACYCDEFCLVSYDCCSDYEAFCGSKAKDCVMSNWESWSDCNARCGSGSSERRRRIESYSENGGTPCGPRRQTRGCYHNDPRCRNFETAQILPAYYNSKRNIEDYYQRQVVVDRFIRPSYCIHYKITDLSWSCKYASPFHVLDVGSLVCLECHDVAMNEKGFCTGAYEDIDSNWRSLEGRPCYGKWNGGGRVSQNCTCEGKHGENFIFV